MMNHAKTAVNDFDAIVSSVIGKGDLSLQKFAFSDRLITSAVIDLSEHDLKIGFDKSSSDLAEHWKRYAIPSDGRVVTTARHPEAHHHLLDLPHHILSTIVSMAVLSPGGIILDLESHAVYGLDLNLLQINRTSRSMFRLMLGDMSHVTVVSKRTEDTTSFENFEFLKQFVTSSDFGYFARNWRRSRTDLNIALHFEIVAATTLGNLRINIKDLVYATRHYRKDKMTVSI